MSTRRTRTAHEDNEISIPLQTSSEQGRTGAPTTILSRIKHPWHDRPPWRWFYCMTTFDIELIETGQVRDFVALERTWLAYVRTGDSIAGHAVVVTQLFALHTGHRTIGLVCGAFMILGGVIIQIMGAFRYGQQCRGLLEKKERKDAGVALTGTPWAIGTGVIIGIYAVGLFVIILVVA